MENSTRPASVSCGCQVGHGAMHDTTAYEKGGGANVGGACAMAGLTKAKILRRLQIGRTSVRRILGTPKQGN